MTREVHPVADLFPMLAEDELAELAADIKVRGLLQPIMLDGEGRILDGRNRLAACGIAGVEPAFSTYDGDDPDGYALAVNIARRHLTQGQRAVVVARSYKLYDLGGVTRVADEHGLPQARLSQARVIVEHADLADGVLDGSKPFDAAHREAHERNRAKETDGARLTRVRAEAPDLAALVAEERMTLADAIAALDERNRVEADRQRRHSAAFGADLVRLASVLDPDPWAFFVRTWDPDANPHRGLPNAVDYFTPKGLRRVAELLHGLADHLDDEGKDLL